MQACLVGDVPYAGQRARSPQQVEHMGTALAKRGARVGREKCLHIHPDSLHHIYL